MDELINKLFRKNTDNIFLQMFRYLFVGTASFLIDFFIYIGLIEIFNANYLISAAIAFAISVLANYYLSTSWVFNQSNIENRVIEFNLFILISIIFEIISKFVTMPYKNIIYNSFLILSFAVPFFIVILLHSWRSSPLQVFRSFSKDIYRYRISLLLYLRTV